MSDLKGHVTNSVTMDDTVVLEILWEGTQDGNLNMPGILVEQPCYKRMSNQGVYILEFSGDRIKETRNYFDLFQVMKEIRWSEGVMI